MKFDCGPTKTERLEKEYERLTHWHRYFLWFPKRIGSHDCRWLEYIYRKGYGYQYSRGRWEYSWTFSPNNPDM